MRKSILNKLLIAAFSVAAFVACNDDEFGDTIFPEVSDALDPTSATFALDTFIIENYLNPYNMRFDYKLSDIEADMEYNLAPASYSNSIDMAVLVKYLWYDVYETVNARSTAADAYDEFFMKRYSPRMIMLVGSPAINQSSGTEVLGLAEGGVKITLYAVNELDISDLSTLNERFFKTLHHEFMHILHQTIAYAEDFYQISDGYYNPLSWQETEDIAARTTGFITAYASYGEDEDFVETIANYVINTEEQWQQFLVDASRGYEEVEVSASDYTAAVNDGTFIMVTSTISSATGGVAYYTILRYTVQRDENDNPILDEDGNLIYIDSDSVDGAEVIQTKLEYCRDYLYDEFGIDLDELRAEVLSKMYVMDNDGEPVKDSSGNYINMLLYPTTSDPTMTVMDSLRYQVTRFEEYALELQNQAQN